MINYIHLQNRRFLKKTLAGSLFLISSLPFSSFLSSALAAECEVSQLVNGLDIKLNCIAVGNAQYATTLYNDPPGELAWYWDGDLTPISCTDSASNCAQLSPQLGLTFPHFDLNGEDFNVELNAAADLGEYAWRYGKHSANSTETGNGTNTESSVLSDAKLAELRQFMTDAINQNQVPGAVLALAEGDKTIFIEAFGKSNTATNTDMSSNHLLHIGSTNKAVTSFLIGALVDEGILQWDTKAQDIYPDFSLSNAEYAAQITIRQLLDMTSGLPKDSEMELTSARILLEGLEDEMIGAPGAQYEYSNLSVSIAAYLAVLAKNKHDNGTISEADLNNLHAGYESLLKEKVLTPIGMNNTYLYVDDARQTGNMASSHHLENGSFVVSESVDKRVDVIAPAGGLKSTAADMLAYMITELQYGKAPNGTQVVSAANVQERQRLSSGPAAGEDYGLCLEVKTFDSGITSIGHSGSFDNFNSLIGIFPSKNIAFVLLTNGDSPEALNLTSGGIDGKIAQLLSD